jgi:hypothetical protein
MVGRWLFRLPERENASVVVPMLLGWQYGAVL